ncbi:MAG: hypothetical protein A2453_02270 [Candidatus Raymondbacteria bacterium RIFOXYC2_FULL_50_21]|nr:MAG: hypothetical protein A2453_02270 [Candidatus Raymondbacteria bacterium RIFOXYC2_FULL_50_21]
MTLEQVKGFPVFYETDVLVVGGGPAGTAAGLAASRNGAQTLIVEQFNCLGGVATAGGHGHISRFDENDTGRRIAGGIAHEIGQRIAQNGFGNYDSYGTWFEVEGLKLILERMAEESNVNLLYHTFFCDAVVEHGIVTGAVVQNKNGRRVIRAKRIIDCTGDGDAAFHAGCPNETGRPSDGKCQPVTLMFTMGGVDWKRVEKYREEYRKKYPDDKNPWKLERVYAEAAAKGDMRPFQTGNMGWWWTPTRPDQVGVNFTHIIHIDSTRAEDLTRATIEGRKQAFETIEVYKKYIPGMAHCHMVSTPCTIGVRESRRIMGDYVLTEDDIKNQREFEDGICYSSFFVDIHRIDGPGMDPTTWNPPKGFKYQIPYRSLIPREAENILTAGRCVSCTHIALGSIRVMVPCMGMGEAAGTAAALSLKYNASPRVLDISELKKQLCTQGCILSEEDIVKAEQDRKRRKL